MNLAALDLNLLRVLDALLAERSVSRAAVRLGLSQPATSNALARLRAALGDPLLVRGSKEMTATPRALALRAPVAAALAQLRNALEPPRPFDPATSERTFVIAASDHAQLLIFPPLALTLAACPGLRLRGVPLPKDFPSEALEAGEVDLVLGAFDLAPGDRAPRGLKRQLLVEERFVAVARKEHPALRGAASLEKALALPQLHISPRGGTSGVFEQRMGRKGLRRNIVLFAPHYLVAPWVLASTDLVAALPERVARRFAEAFPLRVAPLDFVPDTLRIQQLWHPKVQEDPAHRWLRAQVLAAARATG